MPSCAVCSDSLALRVIAISSLSQPAFGSDPATHGLDAGLQRLDHVAEGRFVRKIEIALQRFVNDTRAGRGVAVVEIDESAVEREGALDLTPEQLVSGEVFVRSDRRAGSRSGRGADRGGHDPARGSSGAHCPEQIATGEHDDNDTIGRRGGAIRCAREGSSQVAVATQITWTCGWLARNRATAPALTAVLSR